LSPLGTNPSSHSGQETNDLLTLRLHNVNIGYITLFVSGSLRHFCDYDAAMITQEPPKLYHHGNLREDLVTYALAKIRMGGGRSFSLRAAARACGVTPGAAYRHFADRDALLSSVAAKGFEMFAATILSATANVTDPAERLYILGRTYVDFAATEGPLFRLMFSRVGTSKIELRLTEPGFAADQQLAFAVAAAMGAPLAQVDRGMMSLAWTVAHGAASLVADGVWAKDDPGIEGSLRRVVALIVR
jgi:AcrR family transcriptional regulator